MGLDFGGEFIRNQIRRGLAGQMKEFGVIS